MRQRAILSLSARLHEEGQRQLLALMREAGLGGLTTSCGDIFQVLFQAPEAGVTLTGLARRIRRTKSTTSVMVERLVKLGFVERVADPKDARSASVRLTRRGGALRPVFSDISERLNARLCAGLSETEAETLERLLRKAVEGVQAAQDFSRAGDPDAVA